MEIDELRVGRRDEWKSDLRVSRALGDAWLKGGTAALARVPSAILPNTFNYLLNPLHRDAKRMRIAGSTKANFDPRLLRHLRG
jgi:RES domain-containing protein